MTSGPLAEICILGASILDYLLVCKVDLHKYACVSREHWLPTYIRDPIKVTNWPLFNLLR